MRVGWRGKPVSLAQRGRRVWCGKPLSMRGEAAEYGAARPVSMVRQGPVGAVRPVGAASPKAAEPQPGVTPNACSNASLRPPASASASRRSRFLLRL